MRIVERVDGPDNGDGSRFVRLTFEHGGSVCEWAKAVRLYPDTKLPWLSLTVKAREAYRDITGDMVSRPELAPEHIKHWFPEIA
jgi:hypothetical protein